MRLALLYVVVFSGAIFGLLAFVYWSTAAYLNRNLDHALLAERALLARASADGGRDRLVWLIRARIGEKHSMGWYYELTDASLAPIAGNLTHWPAGAQPGTEWSALSDLEVPSPAGHPQSLRLTYRALPNGDRVLVGRLASELRGFAAMIETMLAVAGSLFLLLAAAAGISTSHRSVARIEEINATSRHIMASGLGRRLSLRGTGDEWDELAINLNSMLERIEQLVETNRQVSDNIAHDLRTPLMRIRVRLERAMTHALDRAAYEALIASTIGELDVALRTFASLLRISRIEASDRNIGFRALDLSELAGEVVELFEAVAEHQSVQLALAADCEAPVAGDRDLLFEAISNLLENAIKHGGGGGKVDIVVTPRRGGSLLSIADHGPGIPPGEREHVFKRFYRLEQSRNTPGNGLGLSLVAAVAHLHGIHIAMLDNGPGLRVELHFSPALPAGHDPIQRLATTRLRRGGAQYDGAKVVRPRQPL